MLVNAHGSLAETITDAIETIREQRLDEQTENGDGTVEMPLLGDPDVTTSALSAELTEYGIPHEIQCGGLKPLVCQHDEYEIEDDVLVNEFGFGNGVTCSWAEADDIVDWPATTDELPEGTEHYWVEVHRHHAADSEYDWQATAGTLVVEAACERRDAFSEGYVGPLPDEYIRLDDGMIDRHTIV